MGADGQDGAIGGDVGALVVRAALGEAGIPASPEEEAMLAGIRQLVRSRAAALFTPEAASYEPADVFRADPAGSPEVDL